MVVKHKHRFTLLLCLMSIFYSLIYLIFLVKNNLGYLINLDLFTLSTLGFSISVILDKISLGFSGLVCFIALCVFWFARYYMETDHFYYRFMWILLSFVISMNMLIISGSLLTLLMGWDGLGVTSFGLIIYYQSKESMVAGFLTLLINRLGDILIMASMYFFLSLGMISLSTLKENSIWIIFLFGIAALTKSAQYPFSVWLPAAMAAPTPVSALVHSSTLVTAGVYLLVRVSSITPLTSEMLTILLFCGSVTSFIGGFCALVENDIKKIIALSTLSQLGIMMFSLGMGMYNLALLHLYTHAMFKALLFLVAGSVLMMSYGVQDIRMLGGVTKNSPVLLVMMNVSAMCLMGLPFLSSFYSKHMIMSIMWSSNINTFSIGLMMLSIGMTAIYMTRMLKSMNWGVNSCQVVQVNTSFMYFMPMFMLFGGSLTAGWFFHNIDMMLMVSNFTNLWTDIFMNSMIMLGLGYGLLLINRKGYNIANSMFYLSPVWYNLPTMYFKISKMSSSLDKGWLEVNSLKCTILSVVNSTQYLSKWPSRSFSFLPWIIVSISISSMYWML